ncbi:MAG: hypothetical protein HOF03_03395 [Candidatus Marinimicrobia bacterium]|nr:hypothetical protein [Candidatus Neomarinimicrobiota bacterium]
MIISLFLSVGFSQRVMLFTKTNDIFTSSNKFTIKNKRIVFWQDKVVLMTVPIKSLVEVRYAEKSYFSMGNPCIVLGTLGIASTMGASAAGQLTSEYMAIGAGGGLLIYLMGKTLNLIGARFGRDIVYEDFDRMVYNTQKLILESINLDMEKRSKESQFMYGPEGRKTRFLFFTWEGKKPWKKKYKPKRKIIRFSFF